LLQGSELVSDRQSKEPTTDLAAAVYCYGLPNGLMFSVRGKCKNVFRFVPPFTTTNEQLDRATDPPREPAQIAAALQHSMTLHDTP